MTAITMDLIKDLREKTGAGIADCKKALTENDGDIEKSIEFLRKAGIAKAEKKAGRAVKEGRILTKITDKAAAMVEVLCETDFVANNEKFAAFVNEVLDQVIAMEGNGCVTEATQAATKDKLTSLIATIGENMQVRRAARWDLSATAASYIHGGHLTVLVEAEGCDEAFIKEICMHIAAYNPSYIKSEEISKEAIQKEIEIQMALPELANKPEQIREKIAQGKIHKWYSDVCLMEQAWFKDPQTSLSKLNPNINVKRFLRWSVGDEI